MSEQKKRYDNNTENFPESLPKINWLSLWEASGCDWSAAIKPDCISTLNQSNANKMEISKERQFGIILGGVLTVLALLGVATFTQSQQIFQFMRETEQDSVEQTMFIN